MPIDMPNVKPLRFYCQKVIPLVYDDSLSYYETLCKIADRLNQMIDIFNPAMSEIEAEFIALREYVDEQLKLNLEQSKLYTDEQIALLENYLYQQIQILCDLIYRSNQDTREWMKLELEIFRNEIKNIGLPIILNPLTGKYESVQDTFDSFYNYLRCEAITAGEFDDLYLTAQEYDDKNISARMFDLYSRHILKPFRFLIRSPFTGKMDSVQNVVNSLAALHQLGITAGAFDNLMLTAQTYDDKNISAYIFDWQGIN